MQRRARLLIKEKKSFECTNEKTNSNLVCDVSGYDCCTDGIDIPVCICISHSTFFDYNERWGLCRTHRNSLHIDRSICNKPTRRGGSTISLFVEPCRLLRGSGAACYNVLCVTGACSETKRSKVEMCRHATSAWEEGCRRILVA